MTELKIHNYKCLKQLKISDLKKVNLFTGKNNTGKSTILEALSLFATKGSNYGIRRILNSRGEINGYNDKYSIAGVDTNLKLLSNLFYNRKIGFTQDDTISISSNTEDLKLRFVQFHVEKIIEKDSFGDEVFVGTKKVLMNDTENDNPSYGIEIKTGSNSQIFALEGDLFKRGSSFLKQINSAPYKFHLINANGEDIIESALLWDKITLSDKETLVIEALKIIEPNITRLSFVGDSGLNKSRYPIVKLKGSDELYPLSSMGDGINRILNLILALVNADNGFLLIDEFENGLHYSIQEKLWEIIFTISNKLNIQVFATTHSNDTIHSFAKILEKNKLFEGSLFRLDRKYEEIRAYPFSKEEITESFHQNINLR